MKKISVKSKKEMEAKISEYRLKGFNIVTFTYTYVEMETLDGEQFIIIEKVK